jgi:hypothetical protein
MPDELFKIVEQFFIVMTPTSKTQVGSYKVFVKLSDGDKQSDFSSFLIDITNPPYFISKIEDISA